MAEFQRPLPVNDLLKINTFIAVNEELRSMYQRRKISKWIMDYVQRQTFNMETFRADHKFNVNHNAVMHRVFVYVRNIDESAS